MTFDKINFKLWLEYENNEIKQAAETKGFHTLVWHRSSIPFNRFDISKASRSALIGPAFYFSNQEGRWALPGENNLNKPYYVTGNIIDLTTPLSPEDTEIFSKLVGKTIDHLPIITLENKFGSLAKGLQRAGYDGAWHLGPNKTKDLAMFRPNFIKLAVPQTYNDYNSPIPLSQRFDTSTDDVRF